MVLLSLSIYRKMNTQTVLANPNQPIQIQLQYPNTPSFFPGQTAMNSPYPVFPSMPPPVYINGYPRWNRHRRLHRSHLRMKNVDWASDDEEEEEVSYPPYTHMHPYAQPSHMHQQPYSHVHPHQHSNTSQENDPFSPPSDDELSYDSIPIENAEEEEPHPTHYPIHSPSDVPVSSCIPINSTTPHISAYNYPPVNGIYTNNDERWTVTTYSKTDDDDCTCFSDETKESDVHEYVIG
jgi:hypothetical protein